MTEIVQDAPAAKLTPFKLTVDVPPVADVVPPQVFDNPFGVATTSPLGKESVKLTPLRAAAVLGLFILNVRLVVLPVIIELAPKDLAMTGGSITVSEEVP